MVTEEYAELTVAVNKYRRYKAAARDMVIDQLADVLTMIFQL